MIQAFCSVVVYTVENMLGDLGEAREQTLNLALSTDPSEVLAARGVYGAPRSSFSFEQVGFC